MAIVTLDQERAEKCLAEIQTTLKKYNCAIVPTIIIAGNQISQSGFSVQALVSVPTGLNNNGGQNRKG